MSKENQNKENEKEEIGKNEEASEAVKETKPCENGDSSSEKTKSEANEKTADSAASGKTSTEEKDNSSDESTEEKESGTKEVSLEDKVAALEAENAELKDQLLRRAADFDNYRKRMIKEKQETYDYANSALLADLLDSLDNFDRTVDAAATATDPKSIADGIKMINSNLVKMLESKYGLVGYGTEGDEFNPDIHEAIGRVEDDVEKETLKQVYLKGYKLKDRPIRLAKVMVSVPKA